VQLAMHRIRRQRWLCRAPSREEAFNLRSGLRQALEEAVPAAFQRAFDAAVPGDDVVHVPRLELRVRVAGVESLAAELPELLRRAAHEQLAALLGADPEPPSPAAGGTRRSNRENRVEALVRYLATGALPWELAQAEAAELREQLQQMAREELQTVLARAPEVLAPLPQRLAFYFRLLQLLPEERWPEIADRLSPRLPTAEARALGRALAALAGAPSPGLTAHLRQQLAAAALAAAGRDASRELESFLDEILASAPGEIAARRTLLPSAVPPKAEMPPGVSPRRRHRAEDRNLPRAALRSSTVVPAQATPHGASLQQGDSEGDARTPGAAAETEMDAFPLAVRCAGLVLLHPFLPRLFESTGLRRAGALGLLRGALPRAAALLHWLATGRGEALEFELGLVKVLLGERPETTLLTGGGLLTADDRAEAEALLAAAIGHWRVLKGTTPAGMRSSFLKRGGLLREGDAGWRLQVEPAAFDVLLDHLPWGISVVKLPWMNQPIFTEWPTP
jgi:contractile injection system tape measure protein